MASYQALPNQVSVSLPYISKNLKEMSSLIKKLKSTNLQSQPALLSKITPISSNLADIFQSQKPKPEEKPSFEALKKQFLELKEILLELESTIQRRSQRLSEGMSIVSSDGLIQYNELAYKNELELENEVMNEKFEEAEKVHKEILALNEIFKDVAVLVNEQGEMLKEADRNVENAEKNTGKASKELADAQEYQSSARRKLCIIFSILLVIVCAVIGFTFKDILRLFGLQV